MVYFSKTETAHHVSCKKTAVWGKRAPLSSGGGGFLAGNREVSELEIAFLFDGSSHKAMTSS